MKLKNHKNKLFNKPTSGYSGVLQDLAWSEYKLLLSSWHLFPPCFEKLWHPSTVEESHEIAI